MDCARQITFTPNNPIGGNFSYPHFIYEDTEAEKGLSNFPNVTHSKQHNPDSNLESKLLIHTLAHIEHV